MTRIVIIVTLMISTVLSAGVADDELQRRRLARTQTQQPEQSFSSTNVDAQTSVAQGILGTTTAVVGGLLSFVAYCQYATSVNSRRKIAGGVGVASAVVVVASVATKFLL